MSPEIFWSLCIFAVGFICGVATIITIIIKVVKSLTKRKKGPN